MAKFGLQWDDWFGMEPERRARLMAHEYERRLRDAHYNDHQMSQFDRQKAQQKQEQSTGQSGFHQALSDFGIG